MTDSIPPISAEHIRRLSVELTKLQDQIHSAEQDLQNLHQIADTLVSDLSSKIQRAILEGEKLDVTLAQLYQRLAELALDQAFDPLEKLVSQTLGDLLSGTRR